MKIPKKAVPYIIFQRTGYLGLGKISIFRPIIKLPLLYKLAAYIESFFLRERIIEAYASEMRSEFQTIKDFMPDKCSAILDIGCGIAGIDILINSYLSPNNCPYFHLLDKSYTEKRIWYSFKKNGAFYNSLRLAKEVLELNGVASDKIVIHEVGSLEKWKEYAQFDLIISLLSWGFHYPVETYIDAAYDSLRVGGLVILDVRKETNGIELIMDKFKNAEVISTSEKSFRVRAKRL